MTTETLTLTPELIQAENEAVTTVADNPNPDSHGPEPVASPPAAAPDAAPEGDDGDKIETAADKRARIAETFKASRRAAEGEPADEIIHTAFGEHIPPFVQQAEADAEAARQAAAAAGPPQATDTAPKTYTLKVRGNDVPVASRDELLQLAEVETDEATHFTDAALIRLAQKQLAASSILEEAKLEAKAARQTARATGSTPPADAVSDELDPNAPADPQHPEDPRKKAAQALQYGSEDEVLESIDTLVQDSVQRAKAAEAQTATAQRALDIGDQIYKSAVAFETANPDLVSNPDLGLAFYTNYLVPKIKEELIGTGKIPAERVNDVVGNTVGQAIDAYAVAMASGKVTLNTPESVLNSALATFRTRYPGQSATTPPAAAPAPTPGHDRAAAKRALSPQPNSASMPPTANAPAVPRAVQVIQNMRKQRGQTVRE